MTYRQVDLLEVWAWDEWVGALARDPGTGRYVFAFTPEWTARGVELSPLVMPLREEPYDIGQWPELKPEDFNYLPPLLSDSLPDAFGNALVNAWMAEQGIASNVITPLDRLAYAADRAPGALEFRPSAMNSSDESLTAFQLADLVVAARRTVRGEFSSDAASRKVLDELIQVGTSAGGARAKAVVAFNPSTYQIDSAYAPPQDGFEQWLIKLDGVSDLGMDGHGSGLGESAPYGRIEYAYYEMALAAGVTMMECRLHNEGPRRHFMTKRFDRGANGERHHVITLCALLNLDARLVGVHSYDQYLQGVTKLGLEKDDLQQAYRRMVFNVMAVNRDDHTKNFSFLRRRNSDWELSPAYDVTHNYRSASEWTQRHNLSVNGRTTDIRIIDLYQVGERHEVPGYRRVVREVRDAVDAWHTFATGADVDIAYVEQIANDMDRFRPV
jgi:serine/threonine-protein kinase HipA